MSEIINELHNTLKSGCQFNVEGECAVLRIAIAQPKPICEHDACPFVQWFEIYEYLKMRKTQACKSD